MKSSTRSQTLEELLLANQRRLHLLEKQAAQFGAHSDPSLLIEIEDLRHKIANIQQTLDMLVSASTSPEAAAAKPRAAVAAASRHPGINVRRIMLPAFVAVVLLAVAFTALARYSPSKTAVASPTAGRPAPNQQPSTVAAAAPGATTVAGGTTAQAPAVPLTVAPAMNLSNSPGTSTEPRLVFDTQDNLHLTWTEDPPQKKADRLYKRMAPDGAWSEAEDLTADFGDLKGSNWLVRAPDGTICMFWYGGAASNHPFTWALRKRCLSAGGWSPADVVSEASMSTSAFATSFDHEGIVHAPWFGIASGVNFGKINLASNTYVYNLAFVIDANNGYHVTWYDGQGLEYRASTDGGQTWSKEEQITNEASSGILAADRQGRVHLVWISGSDIYHQRWSAATGWETAILLTKEFTRGAEPALAVDSEGRAHIVWSGKNGIFYARQVDDNTFAEPVQIAERGETPVVALNAQNIPHIAWVDMVGQETDLFFTTAVQ